jgi:DNA-binding NarL/FixJ family response regulator
MKDGQQTVWAVPLHDQQRRTRDLMMYSSATYDRVALQRATVDARAALEDAALAAAEAAAQALSVAEALDEALAILANVPSSAIMPPANALPHPVAELSPREREVLALVAEGHSNKAIAEALFVSPNTVKTHVASLLNKLHVHTRAQLAVVAARQGVRFQGSGAA